MRGGYANRATWSVLHRLGLVEGYGPGDGALTDLAYQVRDAIGYAGY